MSTNLIINKNGSVTLCGRGDGKCCPVMEYVDKNHIKITDDYNNFIIISKEQAMLIGEGMKTLNENIQQLLFD